MSLVSTLLLLLVLGSTVWVAYKLGYKKGFDAGFEICKKTTRRWIKSKIQGGQKMNDLKPPRAWDKKEKKMFPVDALMWREGKLNLLWLLDEDQQVQSAHPSDVILLMPTGLQDKNGKEIYEGDIVQWHQFRLPISIKSDHGYRFMAGKDALCREYGEHGEVIGNIYENPDLLEEAK